MREVDNNDRRAISSSDCDICANEGVVPTRHPELDGDSMTEAWLDDYCDCRYGRRREDADLDEQGIGEEDF